MAPSNLDVEDAEFSDGPLLVPPSVIDTDGQEVPVWYALLQSGDITPWGFMSPAAENHARNLYYRCMRLNPKEVNDLRGKTIDAARIILNEILNPPA